MKKLFKIMLVAAMIVTGMAVAKHAQAQKTQGTTTVSITVSDAFDTSRLACVKVTLTGLNGQGTFPGFTSDDGTIDFLNIPSGNYELKFELTGYATITHEGIFFKANARYNINESLYPSVE